MSSLLSKDKIDLIKKGFNKLLSTTLKLSVSLILLWLVYSKIPFTTIWTTITATKTVYLLAALFVYALSQLISAHRLLICFREVGFPISARSNRLLYLIGMFYNFFIPGGIGGDAYKVFLLNKQFQWKIKTLGAVVLADRASGLIAICCWIVILSLGLTALRPYCSLIVLPLLLILGIFLGKIAFEKIFPSFKKKYFKLLFYSLLIQSLQLCTVYFILLSLHQDNQFFAYFILFFVSSLLSIFSFSGIGVREFIFLKFSPLFNFNPEVAIAIGLIFTIVSLFVSFPGVFFIFFSKKQMFLEKTKQK